MGDVLLVVMVVVAVTLRGWRVSPVWMLLAAGLLAHVIADVGYVSSGLADERRGAVGAGARARLAAADRRRRVEPGAARRARSRSRAGGCWSRRRCSRSSPAACSSLDHFRQTIDAAVLLSAATLVPCSAGWR